MEHHLFSGKMEALFFVDYEAEIELIISVGWIALRVGEEEYNKAFTSDVI